jgi:hypothetical protein
MTKSRSESRGTVCALTSISNRVFDVSTSLVLLASVFSLEATDVHTVVLT